MTYYDDETGVAIGPWFARSLKAKQGHIVIRVYPDGEYEVYVLDARKQTWLYRTGLVLTLVNNSVVS